MPEVTIETIASRSLFMNIDTRVSIISIIDTMIDTR